MSRTYAILKLLEHGALTVAQVHEIGGWRCYKWTHELLTRMHLDGAVRKVRRGTYALR